MAPARRPAPAESATGTVRPRRVAVAASSTDQAHSPYGRCPIRAPSPAILGVVAPRRAIATNGWVGSYVSTVEAAIADLAGRQKGRLARRQLLALGLSSNAITHRVRAGRLLRLDSGVYALGHAPAFREGRWMTAVLRTGPGAVLSHSSAAALWGLARRAPSEIHMTCRRQLGSRPDVRLHRVDLPDDEVTIHDELPVTTVPRTLFDFAAIAAEHRLERALNQAEVLRLSDPLSLPDLLERHPGSRGAIRIREAIDRVSLGANITRSEFEDRFLAFAADRGLPAPAVNALVDTGARSFECDLVWREQRLIVELDGHAYHRTRLSQEADTARDRALSVVGWTVFRITWGQLARDPELLETQLAAGLGLAE